MASVPKTKKKRSLTKTPGLKKNLFSKIKQEYHDIDEYALPLDNDSKLWLSRFMEEDLGANLNHGGKKIYRKKKDKLASFRRNNQRNRDLYSLVRATQKLRSDLNTQDLLDSSQNTSTTNPEEHIIQMLETDTSQSILTLKEFLKHRDKIEDPDVIAFYLNYYNLKQTT